MKSEEEIATEVESLKAKYPVNYTLRIPLNEDETEFASIVLRKPTRLEYKAAVKLMDNDWEKAAEMLLKTLYIGGDELISVLPADQEKKFDILRSVERQLAQIIKAKEAFLKKN